MIVILTGLPKISLNEWYAGTNWRKRKKIKDVYYWAVKSQFNRKFPRDKRYRASYSFEFASHPLDASNCVAMLKMIEDTIFETDGFKVVKELKITSKKGKIDKIIIDIEEIIYA